MKKTWKQIKEEYPKFIKNKKDPDTRLRALDRIELFLAEKKNGLYSGVETLDRFDKIELRKEFND